jgi:hypothetical protein
MQKRNYAPVVSLTVDALQTYLDQRAAEGYILLTLIPAKKELTSVGDLTVETTVSFYPILERVTDITQPTPAAAPSEAPK